MSDTPLDAAGFRRVMGALPTGVCVLTIVDSRGDDLGMTVGAFCSVSLYPPLVLACIGDDATIAAQMREVPRFAISVLSEEQAWISQRFADREERGFGGVEHSRGSHGNLLIAGATAHLECRVTERFPGGDHTIIVGEILRAESFDRQPLVHHRGAYTRLAPER
jgi:flavin reductase ActVB